MVTAFLCHAAADKPLARELASFLQRGTNATIYLAEGEIRPGESLLAKVQEGLMADLILVLLSPDSAPTRWRREEWMPVFRDEPAQAGVRVASVLAHDCHLPDLLRRSNFFDLTADPLKGFRETKGWILSWQAPADEPLFIPGANRFSGSAEDLESLRRAVADRPGTALRDGPGATALALEFARRSQNDFEAVFWVGGSGRSLTGLAGDLGAQIGLRLVGDLEEDLGALRRFCAGRRFLVVLDRVTDEAVPELSVEGKSSFLITRSHQTTPGPERLPEGESVLLAAMAACGPEFSLELAAEVAGMAGVPARDACGSLLDRGLVLLLNEHGPRYTLAEMPGGRELAHLREWQSPAPPHTLIARRHAETLCRRPALGSLADFELALGWALGEEDAWPLACDLARASHRRARAEGRIADAYEALQQLLQAAEARQDGAVLERCGRELAWIAEDWGWQEEAEELRRLARWRRGQQMFLPGFEPRLGEKGIRPVCSALETR